MKYKTIDLIFYALCFVLAYFIAYNPAFGVIDDHTLIETLFSGHNIPLFVMPEIGRFFPLDGQELNLLSFLFSPSPQVFYIFNALCLFMVAFCLSKAFEIIFEKTFKNPKMMAYIATFLILITPAFLTSWLRLFVPERMEFVFLSLFFFLYIRVYFQKSTCFWFETTICILSAFVALFYKETAFILVGGFAFFHILFYIWEKKRIFKIDLALIVSCFVWLICYIVFVVLQKSGHGMYGDTPYNRFLVFLKDCVNYALRDPILSLGMGMILISRMIDFYKTKRVNPLVDSMLLASIFFILAYIVLGISSPHYSLPAYLFAIPVFFYFVYQYRSSLVIKGVVCIVGLVWILNVFPQSLYWVIHYKFVPQNFQKTLEFLKQYSQNQGEMRIYLEGSNRASNIEALISFQKWMEFNKIKNFDFFSDLPIDNELLGKPNPKSPYSVFKNNHVVQKRSGDLLILMPYSNGFVDSQIIEEMKKENELLFVADSGWNVPDLGIKTLFKAIAVKQVQNGSNFLLNQNIYGLPIYFYVFRKR